MADAKTTDEEELIPVETPVEEQEVEGGEGEETEESDDRLAESEDDHEEDIASGTTNRERRQKRRDAQRRAREAQERKLALLEQQNQLLAQRLAAVEGHAQNSTVQSIEARIAQTQRDIQQAEFVHAKAIEAGNGDDAMAALRIRDQARADLQQLTNVKQQYAQARQPQAPQVDPVVANYAQQWLSANPWYDPKGVDRDSALTKAIDNEIAKEGFDPKSREYWEELTTRVADALGEGSSSPKRKAPPTGRTREHAPTSTRKEIYVTPERKQAMIDSGAWDDPVKRQRMLKAYAEYDRGSAR